MLLCAEGCSQPDECWKCRRHRAEGRICAELVINRRVRKQQKEPKDILKIEKPETENRTHFTSRLRNNRYNPNVSNHCPIIKGKLSSFIIQMVAVGIELLG